MWALQQTLLCNGLPRGKVLCAPMKGQKKVMFSGRLISRVAWRTFVELSGLPGCLPFLCRRHSALRTRHSCRN